MKASDELREISGRATREPEPPPQVFAHELHHVLATCRGAHPRPRGTGDELVPVPVRVALYRDGKIIAFVPAFAFALHPWRPANRNGTPESPAELVLAVEVPT